MKKAIICILCALFTLSLCGCGRGEQTVPTQPVTGTPDGEPKTEEFMNDIEFDMSRLDGKTYTLVGGEYRNISYPEDLPEDANERELPVSEITFHKDMTAHFKYEDEFVISLDGDYNYVLEEDNMLIGFFDDVIPPSVTLQLGEDDVDIYFAFRSDGNLWVVLSPDHPLYEFFFGLYQPAA
ncbi:MAG: hypothetical protein IK108_05895 [Clostridia bacterium]|nr:hypothetical protein [Clostridia bacterium]